jgi:hypothetical protein
MKLAIFIILFSVLGIAAPKSLPIFTMEMNYGDKVSRFVITQEKKKFFAEFKTDSADKRRELKKSDVDYILDKLKAEKSIAEGTCPRQMIQASVNGHGKRSQYSACLGSGTELSKKLQGIADLLVTAI